MPPTICYRAGFLMIQPRRFADRHKCQIPIREDLCASVAHSPFTTYGLDQRATVAFRFQPGPQNPHEWHALPTRVAFCHQTMWEKCIILPDRMLRFAIATLSKC